MVTTELQDILKSPLFDSHENLCWLDRARLSYERFRILNQKLKINEKDILDYSEKLQTLHEWVGSVDGTLMTIMSIHYNLCMGTILRLAKRTPKVDEVLQELETLKSFGVYLGTELGYGNNLFNLQTTAHYDPVSQSFKITTQNTEAKKYMPNTGHPEVPKIAVVFARLVSLGEDCGVFPFIVRLRDAHGELTPGVRVTLLGEKPGYHLDNAVTSFKDVEIPKEFILLGSESILEDDGSFRSNVSSKRRRFLAAIDAVQAGKLSFTGAISTGTLVGCKIAFNYASQKRTFAPDQKDVPLLSYNNQKKDIYSSFANALAIRAIYDEALRIYHLDPISQNDEKTKYCSLAKYFSSSVGQGVFLKLRERLGAQGMFCHNRVIEYLNYVFGIVSAEGDNQILQLKIAKDLILNQSWSKSFITGKLRFKKSLMDVNACFELIQQRETILCRDIKTSFFIGKLKKKNSFEIWNDEVNRSLELGEVHAHHLVFKAMLKNQSSLRMDISTELNQQLCHLAMLNYIEKYSGWYLNKGLISSHHLERWNKSMNKIMKDLDQPIRIAIGNIHAPSDVLRSPMLKQSMTEAFANF